MKKINDNHFELDTIDKQIFTALKFNGRVHLKSIAKQVGVTIDTVHNRIKEMMKNEILWIYGSLDMRLIGYPLLVDVKVRLKNIDENSKLEFINYMKKNPFCTDLIEILGNFDFTCVISAKDGDHLKEQLDLMRFKFKEIIDEVMALSILKTHKFDEQTF